jgi:hypothetical protein
MLEDTFKTDLKEITCEDADWTQLSQNGFELWTLVEEAPNYLRVVQENKKRHILFIIFNTLNDEYFMINLNQTQMWN